MQNQDLRTRREVALGLGTTGLTILACAAAPEYITNTLDAQRGGFGDRDFNAGVRVLNFGTGGNRIVGAVGPKDTIKDLDGKEIPRGDVLDIWTLMDYPTQEYGWGLNTETQQATLRTPDSRVRIYRHIPPMEGQEDGIRRLKQEVVERGIPRGKLIATRREPGFHAPGYNIDPDRDGTPTAFFYATCLTEPVRGLGIVPDAKEFYLGPDRRINIIGKAFYEMWGRVTKADGGPLDHISPESLLDGEFISVDTKTRESKKREVEVR